MPPCPMALDTHVCTGFVRSPGGRALAREAKDRDEAAPATVAAGRLQNRTRAVTSPVAANKRFSSGGDEEEEEEEDYDKLN